MYSHLSVLTTLFNLRDTLSALISRITDQPQEAITKGIVLYNLGEFNQAKTYLTIGATAGDRASQYALAEVTRRQAGSITDEAKNWYRLAGAQDHVYALMRLGDEASLKKAKELAQAEAAKGNADAMLELYELDQNIETLKKAAHAGSLESQYILAVKYDKDASLFTNEGVRQSTIDLLLKNAAESGYSKAMHWLSNRFPANRNHPVRRQWLEKRAELNDVNGVLNYGLGLCGFYEDDNGVDNEYGFSRNLVKGYGLIWLVVETTTELSRHTTAKQCLEETAKEMSTDQIAAAKTFAQQWEQSHPPMSEYRLTYSDVV
ncbi:tetratricopeptide repeat protein [Pseudomonas izuensis]|uniref:tetratricopeptide repeat protein n=1 Tax=Pseudomonas izuensis TaxID=2684212 RepID=UPI001358756E|nr:sel1 repeat family protein [Pseudomonas izuensis]